MKFDITLNKKKYVVEIQGNQAKILSQTQSKYEEDEDILDLDLPDFDFGEVDENTSVLKAALPGTVIAVNVTAGQTVGKGQTLLVLESMKMENAVTAPMDGVVEHVAVSVGSYVTKDQPLVSMKPAEVGE